MKQTTPSESEINEAYFAMLSWCFVPKFPRKSAPCLGQCESLFSEQHEQS
ncbi:MULTISPECIES: hypothetical protein [Microcystis]|uniref:Uncharacterized protein n=2 Tax=Microcystis TaxID=1125 RepID=A0A841UQK2_MICAE|nr:MULTISPECIES: hypothetical protein [Microcystis]MCE2663446.1 hypothetical protein [Microcystis sp. 53602_E8]MDJ0530067.1 hypothetical protein [Microcystis sp. M53600_WE12]MDJ0563645.1 hypothetical protein [Microcystis sp. M49629_WE12]NCR79007.1 hypothetical protein [Microcystis aeruginosa K13-10]NCR83622.1 hypothetical protein [Microcystis aeruginosa K13-05]NCS76687.1 hypothetical protein [Microcystis aeruginosa K13-07]